MGDNGATVAQPVGEALYFGSAVGAALVTLFYGPVAGGAAVLVGFVITADLRPRNVDGMLLKLAGLILPQVMAMGLVSAETLGPSEHTPYLVKRANYPFICPAGAYAAIAAQWAVSNLVRAPEIAIKVSRYAAKLLPAVLALSAASCVFGWWRELRLPERSNYVASLPVVDEIPPAEALECEPQPAREFRDLHPEVAYAGCITNEVTAAGYSFHYHCGEQRGLCELLVRTPEGGHEKRVKGTAGASSVRIHRAPDIDGLVIQDSYFPLVIKRHATIGGIGPLAVRVAPPKTSLAMVTIGFLVGAFAFFRERIPAGARIRSLIPRSFSVLALVSVVVLSTPMLVLAIRVLLHGTGS
ncbi:MAG: hypothetical protein HOW73_20945 [Polyangiaceae bacterium]|nr:hypothetical protein [Polyangiaceae bacterium]